MPIIKGKYYTEREIAQIKKELDEDAFEKFLISGVIGAVTGSSVVGGLLGGDFLGGFIDYSNVVDWRMDTPFASWGPEDSFSILPVFPVVGPGGPARSPTQVLRRAGLERRHATSASRARSGLPPEWLEQAGTVNEESKRELRSGILQRSAGIVGHRNCPDSCHLGSRRHGRHPDRCRRQPGRRTQRRLQRPRRV